MKKSLLLFTLIFTLSVQSIFAKAPDMEYFLPTEYQLMTELYKNDAHGFIKSKDYFLEICESINSRILNGREEGLKYNDTCLAEINFFYNGQWIFSDLEK